MELKKVTCPKCQQEVNLKEENESDLMILACKCCGSFMMYYMGETFEVDEVEMRDMAASKMKEVTYTIQQNPEGAKVDSDGRKSQQTLHDVGTPVRDDYFNQSDISDLRIELESATDCLDFIKSLEK